MRSRASSVVEQAELERRDDVDQVQADVGRAGVVAACDVARVRPTRSPKLTVSSGRPCSRSVSASRPRQVSRASRAREGASVARQRARGRRAASRGQPTRRVLDRRLHRAGLAERALPDALASASMTGGALEARQLPGIERLELRRLQPTSSTPPTSRGGGGAVSSEAPTDASSAPAKPVISSADDGRCAGARARSRRAQRAPFAARARRRVSCGVGRRPRRRSRLASQSRAPPGGPTRGALAVGQRPDAVVQAVDQHGIGEQHAALARRRAPPGRLRSARASSRRRARDDRRRAARRGRPSRPRCSALTNGSTAARTKPSRSRRRQRALRAARPARRLASRSRSSAADRSPRESGRGPSARARSPRRTRLAQHRDRDRQDERADDRRHPPEVVAG